MSIARRLINGSLASWSQILITVFTQVLLVPVYLSSWDIKTYGLWLAIQALSTLLTTIDIGHHSFLSFEFLRIGKANPKKIGLYLWSGVWVGLGVGVLEVILIILLIKTSLFGLILNEIKGLSPSLIHTAGIVIIMQSIAWCVFYSGLGVITRALPVFGYYPRVAWWTAATMAVNAIAPAVAVLYGASFWQAAVAMTVAGSVIYTIQYIDLFILIHRQRVVFSKGSIPLGWRNFIHSINVSAKNMLENLRNVGVRVILAPLTGAANLVAFSTIRTGANFAMQGLHSISNPMLPELMHFLNKREQERSEIALGTIWVVIIALMAPAVVALQTFIKPLFNMWTRGKVIFDPLLFAILSLSVLVYAIAQPAIAIVTGNNLLKVQLKISAVAAVIVVAGMVLMVPYAGLTGAGIILLAAEIATTVGYISTAKSWLKYNGLMWPKRASVIATRAVLIAAVGMALIILFESSRFILLPIILAMMLLNGYDYWRSMPSFARYRAKAMFSNIQAFRK
ncbi:hypothetical protein INP83_17445 [Mucilaginibacter sp. 21P]|uniref:hypothetical protein n=1 Tax=Mucilaginibacter sp. 21P TaxID=2778902 RepID=UPI001C566450|nr:hypothetical protein [Mucilaginibacter sp. 21P]QXV64850.1 hypothetical protein INP83_17445 [Mucilaginibacter sp. 21P]